MGARKSTHEPQNGFLHFEALTKSEVQGRNARNPVPGKSHYAQRGWAVSQPQHARSYVRSEFAHAPVLKLGFGG